MVTKMNKKIINPYYEDIKFINPVNDIYRQIVNFLTIDQKVVSIIIVNFSACEDEGLHVEAAKIGKKYITKLDQDILYLLNPILERPVNNGIFSNDNNNQNNSFLLNQSLEVKLHKQFTYDTRSEVNGIIGTYYTDNLSSEYLDILKPLSQIVGNAIVVNQIRSSGILQQCMSSEGVKELNESI